MCLIDILTIIVIVVSWIIKGFILGICLLIAYFLIHSIVEFFKNRRNKNKK